MTEEKINLTEEQKKELERRLKHAEEHPEDAILWEEVREELYKKYNA